MRSTYVSLEGKRMVVDFDLYDVWFYLASYVENQLKLFHIFTLPSFPFLFFFPRHLCFFDKPMCCQFGGVYGQLELQKFGALRLAVYSVVCRSHYGRPGLARPQQQCTADQRPLRNDVFKFLTIFGLLLRLTVVFCLVYEILSCSCDVDVEQVVQLCAKKFQKCPNRSSNPSNELYGVRS